MTIWCGWPDNWNLIAKIYAFDCWPAPRTGHWCTPVPQHLCIDEKGFFRFQNCPGKGAVVRRVLTEQFGLLRTTIHEHHTKGPQWHTVTVHKAHQQLRTGPPRRALRHRPRQLRCALVSEVVAKQVQLREDIIRAQPPQRALEFVCTGAGAGYRRATPRRCGCFCLKGCKVPVLGCRVGTVPEWGYGCALYPCSAMRPTVACCADPETYAGAGAPAMVGYRLQKAGCTNILFRRRRLVFCSLCISWTGLGVFKKCFIWKTVCIYKQCFSWTDGGVFAYWVACIDRIFLFTENSELIFAPSLLLLLLLLFLKISIV